MASTSKRYSTVTAYSRARVQALFVGGILIAAGQLVALWTKLNPWGLPHWLFESLGGGLFLAGLIWLLALATHASLARVGRSLLWCLALAAVYSAYSAWFDPFTQPHTPMYALQATERVQRILIWVIGGTGLLILGALGTYAVAWLRLISPLRNRLAWSAGLNLAAISYAFAEHLGIVTAKIMPYLAESWRPACYFWLLPLCLGALLLRVPRRFPYQAQELLRGSLSWAWLPVAAFFALESYRYGTWWLLLPTLIAFEGIRAGQPVGVQRTWRILTGAVAFAAGLALTIQSNLELPLPQLGILLMLLGVALIVFARSAADLHGRRGVALEKIAKGASGLVWAAGRDLRVEGSRTAFNPGDELAVAATPEGNLFAVPIPKVAD